MQPLLGGLVAVCTLIVSFMTGNWLWFIAALIQQIIGPYTIFVLMPLNRRLMAEDADPNNSALLADLKRWGGLHLVRTLINTISFVLLCYLLAN
jgi:hypothetical protein